MDSMITAAARALAAGDPVGALKLVALRNDASGLALRGIAMAQLGEFPRARELLRAAASAFGPREALSRARCVVAEAEIALVSRDLDWTANRLESARHTLEAQGDRVNAVHAKLLAARRLLLLGQLEAAEHSLADLPVRLPAPLAVARDLLVAGLQMRRLRPRAARTALGRAASAAAQARIAALEGEVQKALASLDSPAARLLRRGAEKPLLLDDVEKLLASKLLIVDACRLAVRVGPRVIPLARRPVLLSLARELAKAWPCDATRETLIARAFRQTQADESLRVRLRVETGRLRRLLAPIARIEATPRGFLLVPRHAKEVVVLARLVEEKHADVLALLSDGESWSTSGLAQALGSSQRTVQRALETFLIAGKVQSVGRGRARRWMTPPMPGITTLLLLPSTLAAD